MFLFNSLIIYLCLMNHLWFRLTMIYNYSKMKRKLITDYDLLKHILELSELYHYIPVCWFHTQNIVGRENMFQYYKNYCKHNGISMLKNQINCYQYYGY